MTQVSKYIKTGGSTGDWTNGSSVEGAQDGNCMSSGSDADQQTCETVQFSEISNGDTINGIIVTLHAANTDTDDTLQVYVSCGAGNSSAKTCSANINNKANCAAAVMEVLGSASDLWGYGSLSGSQVNNVFYVILVHFKSGKGATQYVDYIQVTIDYTSSGTPNYKTVTGATTPTGALTKETSKSPSGSVAPSGDITRGISKFPGGGVEPTGAVTKETSKYPSGVLSSIVGTLATSYTRLKSIAGGVEPTGAVTRKTEKSPSGSITPAGGVVKQTSKSPSGVVTPTGGLAKQTSKSPSGVLSGIVGTLATTFIKLKTVVGEVTPTGGLARKTSKSPSGPITPSGAVTKKTSKYPSGALGLAGIVNAIKLAMQNCSGAFTPLGTLERQTSKSPSGSVGPTGTLAMGTDKYPDGTLGFTGYLNTNYMPHGGGYGGGVNKKLKSQCGGMSGIYVPRGS